jgi:hypothetical protein
LIDTLAPGKAPEARSASPRRRLTDWAAQRFRIFRWRVRLAAGAVGRSEAQRFGAPFRRFVDYAFKDALRRYRLKPYASPVAVFLAEAPSSRPRPDAREMMIRDYVPGARVFQVPGSHEGCLRQPHVASLAAALGAVLAP